MAKPDPALLDPARYPFHCEIVTRYRDLDSNLHINNGVMASLLEEGRVQFHRATGYQGHGRDQTSMVASLGIEFLGESHFPDPLEMNIAVGHIGRTSYRLDQLVKQGEDTLVYAQCTLVCVTGEGPQPMSDELRASLEGWKLRP